MFDRKLRRSVLLGLALGDGCISERKKGDYTSYKITFTHSKNQLEYLEYKRELLEECFASSIPSIRYDKRGQVNLEKTDKLLRIYRKTLYKHGSKVITRALLDKLCPISLAILYMDDGSCYYKRDPKTKKIKSIETVISLCCTKEEVYIFIKYFLEVYNIQWKIKKEKGWYSVRMGKKESYKFFNLIGEHIIPSMKYKIKL